MVLIRHLRAHFTCAVYDNADSKKADSYRLFASLSHQTWVAEFPPQR